MPSFLPAVVAAAVLAVAAPYAQSKPDFTGTWTIDRDRSESPHHTESFQPATIVITHTDAEVTIETRRATATSQVRYPIGPAGTSGQPGAAGGARGYWSGASLVTEGTRIVQGQTVSIRETRSLDASGTEMTVDTLLVVQHGYTFRGAQNYGAAKDVYRRLVPPHDVRDGR